MTAGIHPFPAEILLEVVEVRASAAFFLFLFLFHIAVRLSAGENDVFALRRPFLRFSQLAYNMPS